MPQTNAFGPNITNPTAVSPLPPTITSSSLHPILMHTANRKTSWHSHNGFSFITRTSTSTALSISPQSMDVKHEIGYLTPTGQSFAHLARNIKTARHLYPKNPTLTPIMSILNSTPSSGIPTLLNAYMPSPCITICITMPSDDQAKTAHPPNQVFLFFPEFLLPAHPSIIYHLI